MAFPFAERFKAPQGEGLYTGTPMAFARLVGCSVGQTVCTACDTDFSRMLPELGGGHYSAEQVLEWAAPYRHLCLTGGEPLDRDIRPLIKEAELRGVQVHLETSGTKRPHWLDPGTRPRVPMGQHAIGEDLPDGRIAWRWAHLWVAVSPKPGYSPEMVDIVADEVKVIVGGLGDGPGWPTIIDAVRWAQAGKLVYIQPRNRVKDVDMVALHEALVLADLHPELRLSPQMHKFLRTR